ncbi:MAG: hypothetical protein KJ000_16190 [Pirellulaceae bacterium]|nr:hypothetical protein [Pirellulaceae bacterium]
MKVMFRSIWFCRHAALPLTVLICCAAIASAQGSQLEPHPLALDPELPAGASSIFAPEVYPIDPGSENALYFASQPLADEPWPESLPPPYQPLPLLDSEFQPEIMMVPDPLDLAQDPWWGEQMPSRDWSWQFPTIRLLRWLWATRQAGPDEGIGWERVAMAPFALDTARPMRQTAFRIEAANGWGLPDRSEAFWARTVNGRGPKLPERSVSYQDIAYLTEVGGSGFSVRTVVPLRILDPEVNANTAGMGDMQLLTKTVLLNGKRWTLTQVNDVWFNTGAVKKGLGKGHISMAPGLVTAFQWSDATYLHAQCKFQFPIAGDPIYSGPLLHWGFGMSHLWYDSDAFAIIPTIETSFVSFLDGRVTPFPPEPPRSVDGETVSTLHMGVRTVHDTGGDWGLLEFGFSGGFQFGGNGWYDSMLRFEFRLLY